MADPRLNLDFSYDPNNFAGLGNYGGGTANSAPTANTQIGQYLQQLQGSNTMNLGMNYGPNGYNPLNFQSKKSGPVGIGMFGGPDVGLADSFFRQTNENGSSYGGWGEAGLGLGMAGANAWLSYNQFNLGKETLKNNERQFALQYGAAAKGYNKQNDDTQRTLLADSQGGGNYLSVDENRLKYGVTETV